LGQKLGYDSAHMEAENIEVDTPHATADTPCNTPISRLKNFVK